MKAKIVSEASNNSNPIDEAATGRFSHTLQDASSNAVSESISLPDNETQLSSKGMGVENLKQGSQKQDPDKKSISLAGFSDTRKHGVSEDKSHPAVGLVPMTREKQMLKGEPPRGSMNKTEHKTMPLEQDKKETIFPEVPIQDSSNPPLQQNETEPLTPPVRDMKEPPLPSSNSSKIPPPPPSQIDQGKKVSAPEVPAPELHLTQTFSSNEHEEESCNLSGEYMQGNQRLPFYPHDLLNQKRLLKKVDRMAEYNPGKGLLICISTYMC